MQFQVLERLGVSAQEVLDEARRRIRIEFTNPNLQRTKLDSNPRQAVAPGYEISTIFRHRFNHGIKMYTYINVS